jgi:hypothetical protein
MKAMSRSKLYFLPAQILDQIIDAEKEYHIESSIVSKTAQREQYRVFAMARFALILPRQPTLP